jgi:gamma-glutamylcyclotransferase
MYYFAYGSNMNWPQMRRRCPSARFVCIGRLPGFRFAIARHSRLRNCGTANIFPEAESAVWGIVYEVSESDMLIMDGFEDGYSRYKHFVYSFATPNAQSLPQPQPAAAPSVFEAVVYIAPKEIGVPLPNAEYKRLMLEGARHWQLPADYCSMLAQLKAAEEQKDLTIRNQLVRDFHHEVLRP